MNKQEQAAVDRVKPLCIDCEHYDDHDGWAEPTCKIAVLGCEPVQGIITYNPCTKERELKYSGSMRETCGPQGRNFEAKGEAPKKPWLDRLISFLNLTFDEE